MQLQDVETELQRALGSFGRISRAPVAGCDPPADLDARREMRLECRHRETDHSRKWSHPLDFQGPETESPLAPVSIDARRQGITLLAGKPAREELHHLRVGIELGKRGAVGRLPSPETQPARPDLVNQVGLHDLHSPAPRALGRVGWRACRLSYAS